MHWLYLLFFWSLLCSSGISSAILPLRPSHDAGSPPIRSEVVFIDARLKNDPHLLTALQIQNEPDRQLDIHVLDGQRDGVEQMGADRLINTSMLSSDGHVVLLRTLCLRFLH